MPKAKQQVNKSKKQRKKKQRNVAGMTPTAGVAPKRAVALARTATKVPFFSLSSWKHPKYKDAIRVKGQDLLFRTQFSGSSDTPVTNIMIGPGSFEGTRLSEYFHLYEKYRFVKLVFHFETSAPATTFGSYIMSYDRDVGDATPAGAGVQRSRALLAMQDSRAFKCWQDGSITCHPNMPDDGYYTSYDQAGDLRFSYQGQFYLWQLDFGDSQYSGTLWIEYEVELFVPSLESDPEYYTAQYNTVGTLNTTSNLTSTNPNLFSYMNATPASSTGTLVPTFEVDPTNNIPALKLPEGTYDLTVSLDSNNQPAFAGGSYGQLNVIGRTLINRIATGLILTALTRKFSVAPGGTLTGNMGMLTQSVYRAVVGAGGALLQAYLSGGASANYSNVIPTLTITEVVD